MVPAKWKTMRPATAKTFSIIIVAGVTGALIRTFDPEGWKPIGAVLAYAWVIFPAWIAYAIVDGLLMDWFGKRDANGKAEEYIDPTVRRLDNIEAAINRLHEYVQEIDPDLAEERELEAEFERGDSLFAGANLAAYEDERRKAGKRTRRQSIWRDPAQ